MAMTIEEIEQYIIKAVPDADVEVVDLNGNGDHFSAIVTAASFKGLSRLAQHRRVYDAFGGRMGEELHALKLTTRIPE
ncbi:BolA family transcriptional regulator [Zymomonas mobilis subsp. mobilis ZM4 = ATCC 31821]|uniref:BolA family protein n=1 Tax=Zymomonas mobilis subsp. mobilis (strain ATCC 31821 / ZM4 / CP4) TaxID=264203 RepID=Q5NLB2_ZYMMO|nr:BolA/IbaG family iron-sulfur metabolism protein [Zymomonas mobilis]AAV90498.1 BolA family protein [Zymomonas mobilis subsp. mobilis ZM4 = ATCC 31821]ACV75809.1 BolA family protein [Zymomonas mobilis subsp. mobilis NCIMB 11163]AHB10597.1 transcriptional regulator, BolA protein family [Zymomonas mobilis subsp. mobilis str. CP4 = NRRL B-14023]AHJ70904.1 putative transcriptional regulator, BolA superfamily [Zymomonas mobilis subsp. mobilis NRRL B-12526]AHJ72757.1 putative transcriptional regula